MSDNVKVAEHVRNVALAAADGDDEAAHSHEDRAREAALRWIAEHGDPASRELAATALATRRHEFERWSA